MKKVKTVYGNDPEVNFALIELQQDQHEIITVTQTAQHTFVIFYEERQPSPWDQILNLIKKWKKISK